MILALRALGIGDLATAVPALRALRAAFGGDRLALAAPRWLAPLVDLVGGIDEQIDVDGPGPYRWPPLAPGWAVNLHGRGPQSHRLLRTAQPRHLIAYACAEAGHHVGPVWRPDEHEVHRWCRLLDWYGIATDPDDLALHRPPPDNLPVGISIVHPGAKAAERRWPVDRFAAVARELTRRGHRVAVTGTPGERGLAEEVAARAGLPGSAVLAGRTDVGALAALVAHGRLLVAGDTGIGHLATGYGTPSVLLFGPVPPALWGPPVDRPWHRALWAGPAVRWRHPPAVPAARQPDPGASGRPEPEPAHQRGRRPAEAGPHPALAALGVAEVLAAVEEVERAGRGAVTAG
ncbi:glycosyltransferase family 9 protein [Plantactinospora sp. KLBMP9567]|uniref:glycosyltransferase family 9 protein n=1 Tax=Plantactinospora sp. KLBMP9567 TaxID=3085900 RepID=UPI002981346B|nr:glycosyltransferase family 9 protein [Plantactinospora sp. KLBMP9567]MDW5322384.1 glycosyltransferase family 9 protein [Plantactinospora sp. KLBMP9567]